MYIPTELLYSKQHTWLRIEGDTGIVGITGFAQSELGEIVYVDLPNKDFLFQQDQVFGSVEAVKTVSDLFMPVSGTILEVNKKLLQESTLVNTDPYGNGWIIKIQIATPEEQSKLLTSALYQQKISI